MVESIDLQDARSSLTPGHVDTLPGDALSATASASAATASASAATAAGAATDCAAATDSAVHAVAAGGHDHVHESSLQLLNHYSINIEKEQISEETTAELMFTFTDPTTNSYTFCYTHFAFYFGRNGNLRGDKCKESADAGGRYNKLQSSIHIHTNILQTQVYRGVIPYKNILFTIQILNESNITLLSITQASTSFNVSLIFKREYFDRS